MATTCTSTSLVGTFSDGDELDGKTLTNDENNIVTLTVRVLKTEGTIKGLDTTISAFAGFSDFKLDSYSAEALNDSSSHYIVTAIYKALDETLKDGDNTGEYGTVESMDYDFSEEPLEAHPNIKVLAKKYGGVPRTDGTYDFPATKPSTVTSTGSGLAFSNAGTDINPLYGMRTYPALQARYNKSFGTKDGWKDYVKNIAKIADNIPNSKLDSALGADKSGRNWLQLPPKIQKEGSVYRVSVDYLLSAPGKKWPQDVFETL
jgi:hypothetical protein